MSPPRQFKVAIIGGGLCGLALAVALQERSIPFTIYEARSSFTEIGAGINVGPNGVHALRLIKASLGDKLYAQAIRNAPPDEDTWIWLRYGAASGHHADGDVIAKLDAPGTGSCTLHRQEFLSTLAGEIAGSTAQFGKSFVRYEQADGDDFVKIHFADGSTEEASVLVACDGIHSKVRQCMFGKDDPVSRPHFNHDGAYRAVIPMDKALEALGESAKQSHAILGPNGYVIAYPVKQGQAMNCGIWIEKPEPWVHGEWVAQDQGEAFHKDTEHWGPRVQRLLQHFESSPAFWAAHQHTKQPKSFTDGRVILIGDAAHSMPPHSGAGSSQAVEDAYVLSEVLATLRSEASYAAVCAALQCTMDVRVPRFTMVQEYSTDAGSLFYSFLAQRLEGIERDEWFARLLRRFQQIWNVDLSADADKAKRRLKDRLDKAQI